MAGKKILPPCSEDAPVKAINKTHLYILLSWGLKGGILNLWHRGYQSKELLNIVHPCFNAPFSGLEWSFADFQNLINLFLNRLGFHQCLKWSDGTGGCNGCLSNHGMGLENRHNCTGDVSHENLPWSSNFKEFLFRMKRAVTIQTPSGLTTRAWS